MIIRKSKLRFLVPTIIYLLVVASNNLTVPGYGRPSILLHMFLIFLAIYLYFIYSKKPSLFILPRFLQFVFFILITSSLINSFMINDYRILTTYFSFMFIFLTVSKYASEIGDRESETLNTIIIFKSIVWVNLIIILLSLFLDGLYMYRYQGIFDRGNSMGRYAGCSFIFSLVCILFLDKEKFLKIISGIVLVMSAIFLLISNSRAPLLATIVSLLVILVTFSIVKKKKMIILIGLVASLLLINFILNNFFVEIIDIYKFKFYRGDGSSGRTELWNSGINFFSFFGSSEYNDISYKADVHNNYLSQTLKYGIINSICFHIIPFYLLIISFKSIIVLRKLDADLAIILGMASFIIIYYVFETASLVSPFWLMLIFTALSHEKIWNTKKMFK